MPHQLEDCVAGFVQILRQGQAFECVEAQLPAAELLVFPSWCFSHYLR
jgi:hypothetical protein